MTLEELPTLNACLNAASALLLGLGFYFIRQKRPRLHRRCMLAACLTSTLFLVSYLTYHSVAGTTRFTGHGWVRPVYFAILSSHTVLAVGIVPLVLLTLHRARQRRFKSHQNLARWTWPLWIYVSFTGVIIYLFLYHLYPAANPAPNRGLSQGPWSILSISSAARGSSGGIPRD
jgi:putative membrane protein